MKGPATDGYRNPIFLIIGIFVMVSHVVLSDMAGDRFNTSVPD
jgi:hypothetical protein